MPKVIAFQQCYADSTIDSFQTMSLYQRTLAEPTAFFVGVGLHSGQAIKLRLLPAQADSGITFVRTDLNEAAIRVTTANVGDTMLATTLKSANAEVTTVEHLLSALCAVGVDNIRIELSGPEVPSMDGSAMPFVTMIRDCGLVELQASRVLWRITKPVSVELKDGRKARFEPYSLPRWEVNIDFTEPVIRRTPQRCVFEFADCATYLTNISKARTFGFKNTFDYLREHNRALGASMANAIVLEHTRILNKDGLRQDNEFAAHKTLDAIGDCYTGGRLVIGRYVATRPGHELNHLLMKKLIASLDCFETVTAQKLEKLPDFGPLVTSAL